jgi:hypothetical protein
MLWPDDLGPLPGEGLAAQLDLRADVLDGLRSLHSVGALPSHITIKP